MFSKIKIKNLFQIKNLIIFSVILGIVKFIEQFTKGKYFHDFNVYLNAIKVLDNSGNPYFNIVELPYLYPPIISKLLETSNQSIFSFFYLVIYISIIFLVYIISEKNFKTSLLISLGVGGILVKSLLTGNISNIFYFLIIFSIFFYYKKNNFLPYYITVFFMSVIKFNFIILFLLPVIINQKPIISNHAFIVFGRKYKNNKNYFNLSKKADLKEAAANLYKTMRKIKKKGFKKIFVTKIPKSGPGIAINDRLLKASK